MIAASVNACVKYNNPWMITWAINNELKECFDYLFMILILRVFCQSEVNHMNAKEEIMPHKFICP
jgi:hypothetical protein